MEVKDFAHAVNIEASAKISLHEQLTEFIRSKIRTGVFKPGEQMIPESELSSMLHISRTTVRQSMETLVDEGLLLRYRRRGSFIADTKMKRPISSLYNYSENMRSLNVIPSSQVLQCEVIAADENIRRILHLNTEEKRVFLLKRLRCGDHKPIMIETSYIPYDLCRGIEKHDFTVCSLYQVLDEEYAMKVEHATEIIAAILIRESDARLLKCKSREAGYQIRRISETKIGTIIEYTTSVTRADMCEFQIELYESDKHNQQKTNVARNISFANHKADK